MLPLWEVFSTYITAYLSGQSGPHCHHCSPPVNNALNKAQDAQVYNILNKKPASSIWFVSNLQDYLNLSELLAVVKKPVDEKVAVTTQRIAEEKVKKAEGKYCLVIFVSSFCKSCGFCYSADLHMFCLYLTWSDQFFSL